MPTGVYKRSEKEKERLRIMIKSISPAVPKGSRMSPKTEFKKGMAPWNKGKPWPEMSGEKHPSRNPIHIDKFRKTFENFKQSRYSKRGAEHHQWKGGKTPMIMKIRNSPQYAEWRIGVFEKNHYACIICGDDKGHNLNAHHVRLLSDIIHREKIMTFEQALTCEALWDIKNGVTVCENCHGLANEISRTMQALY